jgi:anti-sigma regulatory factor (Ser/Thr protein kinase)
MNVCEQIARLGISLPWALQTYMEVPAVPAAAPSARLHTRRTLTEWEPEGQADTVELVVSELVTNAVRASCGLFPGESDRRPCLRLWLSSDGDRVFVQVWDGCDQMPALRDVQPEAVGGRGLVLVDALSQDWGAYRPARLPGKIVWSVIASA